jgi:hypothetical protein
VEKVDLVVWTGELLRVMLLIEDAVGPAKRKHAPNSDFEARSFRSVIKHPSKSPKSSETSWLNSS